MLNCKWFCITKQRNLVMKPRRSCRCSYFHIFVISDQSKASHRPCFSEVLHVCFFKEGKWWNSWRVSSSTTIVCEEFKHSGRILAFIFEGLQLSSLPLTYEKCELETLFFIKWYLHSTKSVSIWRIIAFNCKYLLLFVWHTVEAISWWNSIISCFSWVTAMSRRSLACDSASVGVGCSSWEFWCEWIFSNKEIKKYSNFRVQHGGVANRWLSLSVGFFPSGPVSGARFWSQQTYYTSVLHQIQVQQWDFCWWFQFFIFKAIQHLLPSVPIYVYQKVLRFWISYSGCL